MSTKGIGGQLTRTAPARRSGIVAAMQQTATAVEVEQIALDDIASNPENPVARENDEDLAGLADSIRQIGIVQAVTLVPAAEWLAEHPQHADAVGEKRYVSLAGHRRRAAARLAGQTHVPAMIRPDLASAGASDVQLHENLHRLALTPLQEARAYQAKVEEGFSQRQIAAAISVSQGQIAKRLSLLQLPEPIAVAVDQGWYTVADALELLKLDDDVIAEVGLQVRVLTDAENMLAREAAEAEQELSHADALASRAKDAERAVELRLSTLARDAQRVVTNRRREAQAQQRAEELGAEFIDDPRQKFRGREWDHQIHNQKDIQRHAKKGNLAIAPGHGDEVRYYAKAKDNPKERSVSEAEQERLDAERRKKKAVAEGRKARFAALVQLAGKKPTAGELREQLVLHVIEAPMYDSESKKLARKVAMEAGLGPDSESYWDWMRAAAAEQDAAKREQLAWILVWAAREQQHHYTTRYSQWGENDVGYLDDLVKLANYQPGEWEQKQLAQARSRIAGEKGEEGDEQ